MKKYFVMLIMIVVAFWLVSGSLLNAAGDFKYIGVAKCKMCHKTVKSGDQYTKWSNERHSKAYATLATPESKEVAKKAGVTEDPQKAEKCLKCHVTAYAAPATAKEASLTLEEGVSCEACHGPGSAYKTNAVMKALYAGTQKGADVGLVEPTKEVCVKCHNPESPTYKPFNYEEAVKKISHPVPKK